MPDLTAISVKLSTTVAIVAVLGSILASWYSTTEQLKTATREVTALTAQVAEVKKANDAQHREMDAQAHLTEMKLYEAITTLKLKKIMP